MSASTAKKRTLPANIAKMQERKRRKLAPEGSTRESTKLSKAAINQGKKSLRAEELAWTVVEPPDQLDDYEGFFGLEEIDDIDVVRDEATGIVSYKAQKSKTPVKFSNKEFQDEESLDQGLGASNQLEDVESWDGFEEEIDPSERVKTTKTTEMPKRKERKQQSNGGLRVDSQKLSETLKNNAFEVLNTHKKRTEVKVSAWLPLNLSPETLGALSDLKFSNPTAIQKAAIPPVLNGNDLIGKAPTGSGKTLAFGIPILEYFLQSAPHEGNHHPIALIILPTRELAHQIDDHLKSLFANLTVTPPRLATLTGGLSIQKQRRLLSDADIVIATPGRLWEIIQETQGTLSLLQKISFLVVDEADRLLSEGHYKDLEEILNALDREVTDDSDVSNIKAAARPNQRQTLVFSATLAKSLHQKLSKQSKVLTKSLSADPATLEYLLKRLSFRQKNPTFIDVNPKSQMPDNLREGLVECPTGMEKDLYLYNILLHHPYSRILVFVNSISAVRRLVPFCKNLNLPAVALHSEMPQKARLRSIERFSDTNDLLPANQTDMAALPKAILIATDVAARGLDIPSVQLVIHYHLPRTADMYVHRSGRTARASASGSSIIICAPDEAAGVRRLVVQVHAQKDKSHATKKLNSGYISSIDLDRRIVSRLKPRARLAKEIADAELAKEKQRSEDRWMAEAAEDLGVDLDSDELDAAGLAGRQGRGRKRKEREKEVRQWSKGEINERKAELRDLLKQRVMGKKGWDVAKALQAKERGEHTLELPKLEF